MICRCIKDTENRESSGIGLIVTAQRGAPSSPYRGIHILCAVDFHHIFDHITSQSQPHDG